MLRLPQPLEDRLTGRAPAPWRLPLFLALGGLLFAVDLWRNPPGEARERIRLTDADLALAAEELGHSDASQADPAALEAALQQRFQTEVLVAEARRLGLDQHDLVVKRRLAQKLRFLLAGAVVVPDPSEAELAAFLAAHPEDFARPPRLDLEHRYWSTRVHGEGAVEAARAALEQARQTGAEPEGGEAFVHGHHLPGRTVPELVALFGGGLGEAALALPLDTWSEPVASTYGAHLLRVSARDPGGRPELEEVRPAVARAWAAERQQALERQAIEALVERYERVGP